MGYACGAADLCAAGEGAPHIRQRLYWVADADFERCEGWQIQQYEKPLSAWKDSLGNVINGRRIEPGISPLANGIPGRMGRLRAYGNAVVPQVAGRFIRAYMDCRP
jgi:DNA (cytosine-5)-methyltransferase 1